MSRELPDIHLTEFCQSTTKQTWPDRIWSIFLLKGETKNEKNLDGLLCFDFSVDGGFNISVDCLGHTWDIELFEYVNQTDWQRLAGLYALINSGYADQIVLGTDTYMNMLVRRFGGEGYCRLTNAIIPMLKIAEVSEKDLDQIMVKNPARLLAH